MVDVVAGAAADAAAADVIAVTPTVPRIWTPESDAQVTQVARLVLKQAGVGDRLPTPVDDIVACARLVVSGEVTLTPEHDGFFTRLPGVLRSALKKAMGLVDLREKVIYLRPDVLAVKKAFLKLHESGHGVLPWQRETYLFLDDERSLDADVSELFEHEASRFASDVLFQIDRFDCDAADLPVAITSPLALAKRYGGSAHAAIRRFVDRNRRPCAALVIEQRLEEGTGELVFGVRRVVQSASFTQRFGNVPWPRTLNESVPYALPLLFPASGRRFYDGEILVEDRHGNQEPCTFELFPTKYNAFVIVRPTDLVDRSRTRIILAV